MQHLGGISSSVLSVFFTCQCFSLTTVISYWNPMHLIGWEEICQWKTLTKRLMKCPPGICNFNNIIDKISLLFISLGRKFFFLWHQNHQFWVRRFHSRTIFVTQCCFLKFATSAPEVMREAARISIRRHSIESAVLTVTMLRNELNAPCFIHCFSHAFVNTAYSMEWRPAEILRCSKFCFGCRCSK